VTKTVLRPQGEVRVAAAAWGVSIVLHGLLLWGLAQVGSSIGRGEAVVTAALPPATAHVRQVEAVAVTPKPKVQQMFPVGRAVRARPRPLNLAAAGRLRIGGEETPLAVTPGSDAELVGPAVDIAPATEFFGQFTGFRKICYVVDCSGSMHGRLGQVKQQLKESVASLKPDQFFYIIFFLDGDKLIESDGGRMLRATPQAKDRAYAMIDAVRASGPTNAVAALRRAMEVRDSLDMPPEQIYFLTDGFDLGVGGDTEAVTDRIEALRLGAAPATRINTIGFWIEPQDIGILRRIALNSGGQFTHIE